ncbi:MAG: class I SAM-dependent methyltransferase [Thaumarchaeota archaeon]|nr:class I SAM-dependent methyltransferase [Nitrososphaerota archaeon]
MFDSMYDGIPPWDIGRPQTEFVNAAKRNEIRKSVLDVGCGTGEHVLYFAGLGYETWGIDSSPNAIRKAKQKAEQRRINAHFRVWDALQLESLGKKFDSVIDSGLFHVFSDEERLEFSRNLSSVVKTGGSYHVLCFSTKEPKDWGGPRRITQKEIRETFKDGWIINYVREARFESNFHRDGGMAWFSYLTKI